jgi:GDP-L-fucose synthase
MKKDSRIFLAGHRGLVGSALYRALESHSYNQILTQTHGELDLRDRARVFAFFEKEQPEFVMLAAAKVGGIMANLTYPATFIQENLAIQSNVIEASHQYGVKRLLFLGSSCIYPKMCPQPIREEYLLTGPLEPTNRPYALAKIAGIEMCWSFNRQYGTRYITAMPTNLYGPGDNYDAHNSHVLPALIRKVLEAKAASSPSITVWGSGTPLREFLHSDDLAAACLHLMEMEDAGLAPLLQEDRPPLINIGAGVDLTIRELAETICRIFGFQGELLFDASKPDGTPRKLMDSGLIRSLGWNPKYDLETGIRSLNAEHLILNKFSI